jgi:hypothetical protein
MGLNFFQFIKILLHKTFKKISEAPFSGPLGFAQFSGPSSWAWGLI